jgi:hypothetical protein
MSQCLGMGGLIVVLALTVFVGGTSAGPLPQQAVQKPPAQAIIRPPQIMALAPDLVINKIWFAKWVDHPNVSPLVPITTSLKKGVKVWMVCDLVNQSNGAVKGLWKLGFYIDGMMKWNNSWGDMPANGTLRGLGPYTPDTEGNHSFKCEVDVDHQIGESHEDNNFKEILFAVIK